MYTMKWCIWLFTHQLLLSLIKQTILLHTRTKSDDHDYRHRSLDSFIQDSEID